MRTHSHRTLALALTALALAAGTAGAQGKGRGNGRDHDRTHDRTHDRGDDHGMAQGNAGRRVPPGLAKKGGLPPGQAKKLYRTDDGVGVLRDVFGRNGYTVVRTVSKGDTRHVYYRDGDGAVRRAVVSPGEDRLRFGNVPGDLLRQVVARLY
jgi:hypothetical protein